MATIMDSNRMPDMNIFRVSGDLSHALSKCILIWAIHRNRSAEGVSLLTQLLYMLVFMTRYLDLFFVPPLWSKWNFTFKILYLTSSAYIIFLMMRRFARSREREYAWKLAAWCLTGSVLSAPVVCIWFEGWEDTTPFELFVTFSIILESVCVLPQLLLLRQTSVPTVIDSYYLVTLGVYRFFYILNWLVRAITESKFDWTSFVFGIVQTAFYADFAWVYWSRQRVKLRRGGIVDSDDLSKSFLVRRFLGRRGNANGSEEDDDNADEDAALAGQESGTVRPIGRSWGPRGVSVSADDTLQEHMESGARDAQMVDPTHFDDDDDADAPPPPAKNSPKKPGPLSKDYDEEGVESSAGEWQENTSSK